MPRSKKPQGKKGGVAMQSTASPRSSKNGSINPLVGAAVGAAVGGVVGAAAAVALSDDDTRKRVKEVAGNLKDQATERMHEMSSKAKHVADTAKEDVQHQLENTEKNKKG